MPERFLTSIALSYVTAILLSFLLENLLQPRPLPVWQRSFSAVTLHKGIVTILFALELLLFRRPWFAAANVMALLLFLTLVNNAKFHSLREPFICQDFEYFSDALKHPRLYLPFLGLWRAVVAAGGILGALAAGILLETPLHAGTVIVVASLLLLLGAVSIWLGNHYADDLNCQPTQDTTRLGQLACLWLYGRAERKERPTVLPVNPLFRTSVPANNRDLPDLVVVQSESFFDPRRAFSGIRPEILEQFDHMKSSAITHGKLRVPAWGANTVRSEYAFLSGLEPEKLGIHRFNPYRWIASQGIPTLASFLQQRGYRTVCIHPYPADFYGRNQVYPQIGFDEFIDIATFQTSERSGPYVGDCAVAARVHEILKAQGNSSDRRPLFIFVITMENHGPLHLEKISAAEATHLYSTPPPQGCDELSIYLRHLRNADRMAGMLRRALESSERTGILCFFGDHLPIMEKVYGLLGTPDGDSEYLLWSNRGSNRPPRQSDLDVWDLAGILVTEAGLEKL
jgi:hypothetical protein